MIHPPTKLSLEQQAVFNAVQTGGKDVLCIAGPGSGKTHTLISSLCGLVQNGMAGEKIVAITFTNNAAAELQVRLVEKAKELKLPALHRIHTSTFHSWVGQLASLQVTRWTYPPVRLDTAGLAVALHLTNPDSTTHVFTKAEISAADRHLERSETFDAMEQRNFNRIGPRGSNGTNRTGFDNLVKALDELTPLLEETQLGSYGSLMAAGASLATKLIPGSISWLFIDEAQDLNAPQAEFVAAVQKQTDCRVFAIADDDQGIYKFRGASNQFLREFGGKPTTTTLNLNENFRSTQPIVKVCRNWITPNWTQLSLPHKSFESKRTGLPVVLLQANFPAIRGKHAKIIIEAAIKAGVLKTMGEAAILSFSSNNASFEIRDSELPLTALSDRPLPHAVLNQWLELCTVRRATGDWHHLLWQEFLDASTAEQTKNNDPILGHPGLNGLYAALEAIRRIHPQLPSDEAAKIFSEINRNRKKDFEKFFFLGERPEPDYTAESINYLSLHSCKGMEFPVVWLSGCGFAFGSKSFDEEQGQPNSLGELWEYASKFASALKAKITGTAGNADPAKCNQLATEMENRRLLYVGMSRATDLLIISAPPGYAREGANNETKKRKADDDQFKTEIEKILKGVDHRVITTDPQATAFALSITAAHRHPTWKAPTRYRVESFTSLTRQPQPGETLETEIPREREFPLPQSDAATIGDQFHRIMHLLCLEPQTLAKRLADTLTDADLIARVSTGDTTRELAPLVELLASYFSDSVNQPWTWLVNAKSEVPFTHVTKNKLGETVLFKGYIDLVGFDHNGKPNLIVDYKTGKPPATDSPDATRYQEQIKLYQEAIAATYSVQKNSISLLIYYPLASARLTFPNTESAPPLKTLRYPLPPVGRQRHLPLGANHRLSINHHVANQTIYLDLDRLHPHARTFRQEGSLAVQIADWNNDSTQAKIQEFLNGQQWLV